MKQVSLFDSFKANLRMPNIAKQAEVSGYSGFINKYIHLIVPQSYYFSRVSAELNRLCLHFLRNRQQSGSDALGLS